MSKERLRSLLDPIDQPYADWMHIIVVADGPRAGAKLPIATLSCLKAAIAIPVTRSRRVIERSLPRVDMHLVAALPTQ